MGEIVEGAVFIIRQVIEGPSISALITISLVGAGARATVVPRRRTASAIGIVRNTTYKCPSRN